MTTKELYNNYVAGTYLQNDVCITHGKNATLYGENGNKYLDFGSGIAVNAFGVGDEGWKSAIINQLNQIQHTSNLYYTKPQAELAKVLCERTGMKKVFFSNSGAEANECAIKTARKYGNDKSNGTRNTIITLKNSFHGRTIATLSATGQEQFHQHFSPFVSGFVHVEPNNIAELEAAVKENKTCAIMIELIQGESGINVLEHEYVKTIKKLCAENDILLIIDEVQSGNARTGALYCYMHYGLKPDIVTTAKGLAGGLPIGATMFSEKTENVLSPGTHGSTFGGNPVCCAAGLYVMERLNDSFINQVKQKGELIKTELSKISTVKNISGMGLMIGFECGIEPKAIINECLKNGLLLLSAKQKIRLLPPLTISNEEILNAIQIIKGVIEK